jgi:DNA-binding NtrC family response regulator
VRILVVEDEPGIREFLTEGLASFGGITVDTASDGSSIAMARRTRYDLVLTDMHLADDLDGLTVIRAISAFDSDVRFIVMTGKKRLDVATRFVEAIKGHQVVSFLFKPFDLEELRIAVERVRDLVSSHSR